MPTDPNAAPSTNQRPAWNKRLFAAMMASESKQTSDYEDRKRALLGDLHGQVLEIGPGTGPNLAYYAPDVTWLGIEPNPAMFPYLQREAQKLGRTIQLRQSQAERLDATDNSMDAVVCTLVLCSVRDPGQTLQEVLRVLKPGGRFIFIEHVAAAPNTGLRRWQAFVRPIWQRVADGCQPDRETWVAIQQAGFAQVQLEHFKIKAPFVGPHIAGFAVK